MPSKTIMGMVIAAVSMVTASTAAQAIVIDMESLPPGGCYSIGSTVTTQGFNFGANDTLFSCDGNVLSQDSTRSLIDANAQSIVTMAAADSSLFTLNSFDSGSRIDNSGGRESLQVQVLGNISGGGTVSQTFTFNGSNFETFTLNPGFTNLTSVVFTGLGTDPNPEMVLDNIVVNASAPASIPSLSQWGMIILSGLLALGAIFTLRRQRH